MMGQEAARSSTTSGTSSSVNSLRISVKQQARNELTNKLSTGMHLARRVVLSVMAFAARNRRTRVGLGILAFVTMASGLSGGIRPPTALADTAPWGTLEMSGSSWMFGHGVTVYSNGPDPNYYSNDNWMYGNKYQCVELAQYVWGANGWDGTFYNWGVNANGIYASAQSGSLHQYARVVPQYHITETDVHPGDLITYAGGSAGHVVVVDKIVPNSNGTVTVYVVGQNQGNYGPENTLTLSNGTLSGMWFQTSLIQGVVAARRCPARRRTSGGLLTHHATSLPPLTTSS